MKLTLSFKTPDVADYALEDIEDEDQKDEAQEAIDKWVKYGECLNVEIDTETGEARVLPA